tara:strand:+ start:839 stop:1246 length:408 start_codon:yes stop_codon:yes gene_type:complete
MISHHILKITNDQMNDLKLEDISSKKLLDQIIKYADQKKAENIITIDLRGLSSLSDYFLICHGNSEPQIKAIADNIRKNTTYKPKHIEGYENKKWILLDYFDVIVHIFDKLEREYYELERIWADAPINEFHNEKH